MRALLSISLVLLFASCEGPAASEGEGEGDAGESEGDVGEGEGEGEGEPVAVEYQWERGDGTAIPGDVLDLGAVDAAVTVDLAVRNIGAADFAILTDPPILVAGTNADAFAVVAQPASIVPEGETVA